MTATASDRRDRLRVMLADLKMPGALEAVDGVLAKVDSGAVSRPRPRPRSQRPTDRRRYGDDDPACSALAAVASLRALATASRRGPVCACAGNEERHSPTITVVTTI